MTHAQVEVNEIEALRPATTGRTHRELLETRNAEAEEEEEEDDDDEDDDEDEDEDEDEEGGDGDGDGDGDDDEEAEAQHKDEDAEEEDPEPEDELAVPDEIVEGHTPEDRFFKHNETLRGKYNEVELDQFMKILNVKPIPQWQENNSHHYKAGIHDYEDESQELDPYYHLLGEVERKHLDRQRAYDFRRGTEVKIVLD